ncbi:MOSC domain-containing protein [Paenalcaligenes hominis]|uniref:MOSC domain-containing protein n=1 Tax=Paenalcaligenes hominis TaxID=643674 RepID=UPI003526A197
MNVTITQLITYPVKSCAGIQLERSAIDYRGLQWDRQWVVVDELGQMLTQRTLPQMVLVQPSLSDQGLHLNAPHMPELTLSLAMPHTSATRVQIWDDVTWGADQGEAAADWWTHYLKQPCRLLRVHTQAQRGLNQTWVRKWLQADTVPAHTAGLAQTTFGFADGFPFLICNEASLTELNILINEQGAAPVGMDRFRPNIVIQGLEAYDEDHLLSLGNASLQFAKLKNCTRCPMPNVDPSNGVMGLQPALALRDSRRTIEGITFGVNAALYDAEPNATLEVGQGLQAVFNF